jgi:hypothetical protein
MRSSAFACRDGADVCVGRGPERPIARTSHERAHAACRPPGLRSARHSWTGAHRPSATDGKGRAVKRNRLDQEIARGRGAGKKIEDLPQLLAYAVAHDDGEPQDPATENTSRRAHSFAQARPGSCCGLSGTLRTLGGAAKGGFRQCNRRATKVIAEPKRSFRRVDTDREERERDAREKALDEALKNTFPASDPVSIEQPKSAG